MLGSAWPVLGGAVGGADGAVCREYLTGFSKRKKARELAVRTKAIDREREEKNESRRAVSRGWRQKREGS